MSATPATQPSLLRAVSRWQVVSLAANDVIGSGVYLLPATAALFLGAASPWAVLAAGGLVLMLVLCFAEAGSLFDEPGGAYVYTREAFGDFIGFEVGWMTWIARLTSTATLSAGFAQAVAKVWPLAGTTGGRELDDRRRAVPADGHQRGRGQARRAHGRDPGGEQGASVAGAHRGRRVRDPLGPALPGAAAGRGRAWAARRCCCCSPTPASRTPPRRRASTRTRSATSRSG